MGYCSANSIAFIPKAIRGFFYQANHQFLYAKNKCILQGIDKWAQIC
ncbi:hypothetical protein HMPREF1391_01626 [Helicobacter pylori GAM100Ai]|uniref:Uncharacterized protein n=2 Tax=Helicobacter pylori TaxID=210 RepID=A0AB72ZS49_HELPX|nr:hypothetical protein HMPREF1391_01626 [Helicobacter pylori GAM100Ai]